VLGAMAGVINDVPDGYRMIGIPATPEREQKIKQAVFSKLPEMRRQLKKLQRTVDTLIREATAKDDPSTRAQIKPDQDDLPDRRAVA
jgi:UDP-3-O-[3-hydroxymyristoyl] glucosamine N-acyltransferase